MNPLKNSPDYSLTLSTELGNGSNNPACFGANPEPQPFLTSVVRCFRRADGIMFGTCLPNKPPRPCNFFATHPGKDVGAWLPPVPVAEGMEFRFRWGALRSSTGYSLGCLWHRETGFWAPGPRIAFQVPRLPLFLTGACVAH